MNTSYENFTNQTPFKKKYWLHYSREACGMQTLRFIFFG